MKRSRFILMAAFGAVLLSGASVAAPVFMKFDGVDGEFAHEGNKGWIVVESIGFATPLPTPPSAPAPAGVARGGPGKFSFTKKMDKTSPIFAKAATAGKHFPSVVIDGMKAGSGPAVYYKYELKDVMVTSFRPGGGGVGGALPVDQGTFNFASIELKYGEQKGPSRPGPGVAPGQPSTAPGVKPK